MQKMYLFLGSPCLSFDIIPDNLGDDRADRYPLTLTLVGGTQHEKVHCNHLLVMKLSNMQKSKPQKDDDDEDEESESDSDDEDSKPSLECASIRHPGSVNRVKVWLFKALKTTIVLNYFMEMLNMKTL